MSVLSIGHPTGYIVLWLHLDLLVDYCLSAHASKALVTEHPFHFVEVYYFQPAYDTLLPIA